MNDNLFDLSMFPRTKHEAAEKTDAFALKQYALKAMNVIDKQKEKKCLKVLYNEGMLSAHDYTEAIIESGGSMENVGLKIAGNFEKEHLIRQYRKIMDKEKTSL